MTQLAEQRATHPPCPRISSNQHPKYKIHPSHQPGHTQAVRMQLSLRVFEQRCVLLAPAAPNQTLRQALSGVAASATEQRHPCCVWYMVFNAS